MTIQIYLWREIRKIVVDNMPPGLSAVANMDILTLNFPKNDKENCCIWLVGTYMDWIWKATTSMKFRQRKEELFGYLKFKYKVDQLGSRMPLQSIPTLSL